MSQKKVDEYKEYKKNREQILKKEKTMKRIEMWIAGIIAVAFIAWFGFSIYNSATRPATDETGAVVATELDVQAYAEYLTGLQMNY